MILACPHTPHPCISHSRRTPANAGVWRYTESESVRGQILRLRRRRVKGWRDWVTVGRGWYGVAYHSWTSDASRRSQKALGCRSERKGHTGNSGAGIPQSGGKKKREGVGNEGGGEIRRWTRSCANAQKVYAAPGARRHQPRRRKPAFVTHENEASLCVCGLGVRQMTPSSPSRGAVTGLRLGSNGVQRGPRKVQVVL